MWVVQDGDCQLWQGRTTPTGPRYDNQALHPYVAEIAGIPSVRGMRYYTICGRRECIEPEHLVHPSTEVGKMLYIKERVSSHPEYPGCLAWTKRTVKGFPVMMWKHEGVNVSHSVRKFVYRMEWGIDEESWAPRGVVVPRQTCHDLCVEATHLGLEKEEEVDDYSDDLEYDAV